MQQPKPFSPADVGTPEAQWRAMLQGAAEWRPTDSALVVVAPHPDDEVLGAGGLIRAWADAGRPVLILSVTDGEAADPERSDLGSIRRDELRDALRTLCHSHVEIRRLSLPDGDVKRHVNRLRSHLIESLTADTTIIAPYECDGHPDHDSVGLACLQVARAHGVAIARYPVWTWHHADPASMRSRSWGLFPLESAAQSAKWRAIQCFKSQLHPLRGEPIVPPHVLLHFQRSYEAFLL